MTNYYTDICTEFPATEEQAEWMLNVIDTIHEAGNYFNEGQDIHLYRDDLIEEIEGYEEFAPYVEDFGDRFYDLYFNAKVNRIDDGLEFSSDESAEPDHVAWLIHEAMKKFNIEKGYFFEWASTASRPMIGAYGGGAVAITRKGIKWYIPGYEASLHVQRHEEGLVRYYVKRLRMKALILKDRLRRKTRQWQVALTT